MTENVVNLAASALTSWKAFGGRHDLESTAHEQESKRSRVESLVMYTAPAMESIATPGKPALRPYPFFYYRDHSTEQDPDPLTPLTFPGRVPNFPAKLHAILSQPDLADVIDWLPHGRSWRVLKPREFETKVIPRFFEHSKFSSFVRQANGWGFRRITQGPDRNSYYHEKFLRGLPHLCKTMKRPGVAEKRVVDPDLEPDFYKISDIHPVPENADDESIFLQKTLQSGPKARMPIITGHFKGGNRTGSPASTSTQSSSPPPSLVDSPAPAPGTVGTQSAHMEQMHPTATSVSEGASMHQPVAFTNVAPYGHTVAPQATQMMQKTGAPAPSTTPPEQHQKPTEVPAMNQVMVQFPMPQVDPNNPATSSFAAGFAAATAQYQQHFMAMLNSMGANKQLTEGYSPSMVLTPVPVSHVPAARSG